MGSLLCPQDIKVKIIPNAYNTGYKVADWPHKMQTLIGVLKFLLEKSLARDHSRYVIGAMEIKLLALLCFRQGSSIGTDTVAKMTQGSCIRRTFVRAWERGMHCEQPSARLASSPLSECSKFLNSLHCH